MITATAMAGTPGSDTHGVEHRLEIAIDIRELRRMSDWMRRLLREAALPRQRIHALELCANEAVANIMLHATGAPRFEPIRLTLRIAKDQISLRIEDKSDMFDPISAQLPAVAATLDDAVPGGMGLVLIRRLLPASTYERLADTNVLVLTSGI